MNRFESPDRRIAADAQVSVVLPVFNEARVLPPLLKRVSAALESCCGDYEVLFVDDGSTDESPTVLDSLAEGDSRVRVIHLSRNFGHQAAVQAGLEHARGDAVILMDSDMQDAPEALPLFVAQWELGYDVVYAIRTQRKEGFFKRFLFAAFHRFMANIASVRVPADAGIFGLIDRRVARHIISLGETDRYFPGLRSWVGFRQQGVVVPRGARYDDYPRVSMRGLIRLAKTAIFSFSSFPLAIFYVIGAVATALFLCLGSYAVFCRLFTDLAVPGWTSHILTGSFFGALNALGICILGEYVIRTYDQVRGRPLYLVDRTVNIAPPPLDWDDQQDDRLFADLLEHASELLGTAAPADTPSQPVNDSEQWSKPIPFPASDGLHSE